MIEGDETTLKSILEERNEMKQKLGASSDDSDLDDIAVPLYPLTEAVRGRNHFNNDSDNDEPFG